MRKSLLICIAACCMTLAANAQEALWSGTQVQSPVVNPDRTVTFSLFEPKAVKVEVTGDFLPPVAFDSPMGKVEQPGTAELTEDKN